MARWRTHEDYVEEIEDREIKVLEKYQTSQTKIKHKCLVCDYKWKVRPNSILRGSGCPRCNKLDRTHEEYIEEIKDRGIKVLGEYQTRETKIKHKCLTCGYEWKTIPKTILQGHGCPRCHRSKGEDKIESILQKNEANFTQEQAIQGCRGKRHLRFDFCLTSFKKGVLAVPKVKATIEHDGKQHFTPIDYFGGEEGYRGIQRRDQIKNNFCSENNIPLLRVSYKDRDNGRIEEKVTKFLKEHNILESSQQKLPLFA